MENIASKNIYFDLDFKIWIQIVPSQFFLVKTGENIIKFIFCFLF